jgi:hypothetical protein
MENILNFLVAQEHIADLHRNAGNGWRSVRVADKPYRKAVIALRTAGSDEAAQLRQLAALDSARPLEGESLVALVDGRLVAAISLKDGRIIADPLAPTTEARGLLQTRAAQLAETPRRPRRRFRPRFA